MRLLRILLVLTMLGNLLMVGCTGQSKAEKHFNNGVELQEQGRWEESIIEYDEAISLDPDFVATVSTGANNPKPKNGISPGEYLGITFTGDYSAVIASINDESLRIGLHVTGINGGTGDAYVNLVVNSLDIMPVHAPVPGAFLLGFLGLTVSGVKLRKYA